MATDIKSIFTFEPSLIVGKLHLAGRSQIKDPARTLVVNSGIKDDVGDSSPDKPGKISFDFKMKSYEVCIVKLNLEYTEVLDIKHNPDVEKAQEKVDKVKEKNEKNDSITDEHTPVAPENKEKTKAILKLGVKVDIDASARDIKDAVDEENEKRKALKEKDLAEIKTQAIEDAQAYFETFCGKENYKAPKPEDVPMILISTKTKDFKSLVITDGIVLPIDEKDMESWKAEYVKGKQDKATANFAFKFKYDMTFDTD